MLAAALTAADVLARSVVGEQLDAAVSCRVGAEAGTSHVDVGAAPSTPRLVTGSLGDLRVDDVTATLGDQQVPANLAVRVDDVSVGWWSQGTQLTAQPCPVTPTPERL